MSSQDNTNQTYTKRIRGLNMVAFNNRNPGQPLGGPNGNTTSLTYTDTLIGRGSWVTQGTGTRSVKIGCCDEINVLDIINLPEPEPDIPTDIQGFYVTGVYDDNEVIIYNVDNTVAFTLPEEGTNNNVFIAKYNRSGVAQWATRISGIDNTQSYSLTTDSDGNVYIVCFTSSSTINLNIYNQGLTEIGDPPAFTLTRATNTDWGALVKYDTYGTAQWATKIQGTADIKQVSLDTQNNIYLVGFSIRSLTFYDSPGITNSIPVISNIGLIPTVYLVKYNNNGIAQWATNLTAVANSINSYAISVDINFNVYVYGIYQNGVNFYNSPGNTVSPPSFSGSGYFLAKYDQTGNFLWKTRMTAINLATANIYRSIIIDKVGNIYLCGPYSGGNLTIYNSNDTITTPNLVNSGGIDGFLLKYNDNGFIVWSIRITGNTVYPNFICLDKNLNIFITGEYRNSFINIYNPDTSLNPVNLTYTGVASRPNMFLIKFDSSGIAQWAVKGGNSISGICCAVDFLGNIYVTGTYSTIIANFYNQGGTSPVLTLTSVYNDPLCYIVKYNTNGFIQLARNIGGESPVNGYSISAL